MIRPTIKESQALVGLFNSHCMGLILTNKCLVYPYNEGAFIPSHDGLFKLMAVGISFAALPVINSLETVQQCIVCHYILE